MQDFETMNDVLILDCFLLLNVYFLHTLDSLFFTFDAYILHCLR